MTDPREIRTSDRGLALIRASEGCEMAPYRDPGGVLTIYFGHTKHVLNLKPPYTRDEAERLLREDVADAEDTIRAYLPDSIERELPQACWDALVDFVFNLGAQAFRNPRTGELTGLARELEARRWENVPAQFKRWVYDNGRKLPGLVKRRDAECALWSSAEWKTPA